MTYPIRGELTLNELGDALADGGDTSAGAVGTDRANLAQEPLGALNDIGLVAEVLDESLLALEELGVLEDTGDLAEEGQGLLVELLRVSDVGRDDMLKGEVGGVASGDLCSVLLGLDSELTADGVLGSNNVLVDVVDGQSHFCGGG